MTKGTLRVLHPDLERYEVETIHRKYNNETHDIEKYVEKETIYLTPKIRKLREKVLSDVMKKLSKKNINITSTEATDTHTIINYEVLS
jgi:hypothetical protein